MSYWGSTQLRDLLDNIINPAKEDGNLLSIKTKTDNLDVLLSTKATETTLSAINNKLVTGTVIGDVNASQKGNWSVRGQDGAGNSLTSQVNGTQRALDVGIDVAGVQVDPRQIRALTNTDVVKAQIQDNAGVGITLGQKTKDLSIPIVFASDQNLSSYEFNKNGYMFSTIYEWTNVGTTEMNLLHLVNPSGSGKNLIIWKLILTCFDTVSSFVYFRIYTNPTITGNGTALTISNGRVMASPNASIANAYRDPTTSALGTFKISCISAGGTAASARTLDVQGSLIIEPNNRILVTGKADGSNRDTSVYVEWSEE